MLHRKLQLKKGYLAKELSGFVYTGKLVFGDFDRYVWQDSDAVSNYIFLRRGEQAVIAITGGFVHDY